MKILVLFMCFVSFICLYSQNNLAFPIDFENASTPAAVQIVYFGGGAPSGSAVRVANPDPTGQNQSAYVVRFIKGVNAPTWAGMEFPNLATATSGFAGALPYLCFDYYTTAPVGTPILFKMDGAGDINSTTTVQNAWGQICFTPPTTHNARVKPVIIFRLGQTNGGTTHDPNFTLYVDNINQYATIPLAFTPNSEYFCPDAAVTFDVGSPGNWYAEATGGSVLAGGSNTSTYTSPVLTGSESYFFDPQTSTAINDLVVGPTNFAYSVGNPAWYATQRFISNLEDGATFNEVSMTNRRASPGSNITGSNCNWRVCARNLTSPSGDKCVTVNNLTDNPPGAVGVFNFDDLTMNKGDVIEVTYINQNRACAGCDIAANYGCAVTPLHLNTTYTPYPKTPTPEVTWTYHHNAETGVDNNRFIGYNYKFSGNVADPRVQVNAIANCAIALPVDLIKFTAKEERGDAILTWITASETNNDYFIIRKTKDGVNFENIGTMKGAGTTSTMSQYSFTDTNLGPELTYYQIVQVDYDGKKSESWLVSLDKEMSANYNIFPNPTDGVFTLSKTIDVSKEIEIEIKDLAGRTIEHYNVFGSKPLFKEIFNIHDYPSGVYTLIVSSRNQRDVLKLIKQ
jgi:hypothetical protein